MHLKEISIGILQQLFNTTQQLSGEQFTEPLQLLSGSSIGKHLRHIIEFYDILVSSHTSGKVCYDNRSHDQCLESNKDKALKKLQDLCEGLEAIKDDKKIIMEASYSEDGSNKFHMKSSMGRELAFNLEHAIHHMAIIKIAIQSEFPEVALPHNFGIAYSTIQYERLQTVK